MSRGFIKHINNLIRESDIIIEVLDARRPEETRNYNLENMAVAQGKKVLLVINKADLIPKEEAAKKKQALINNAPFRTIFLSALGKDGINLLRKEIGLISKDKKTFDSYQKAAPFDIISKEHKSVTIGIIGYPNVGKSSLINALAGRGRGRVATSRKAGLTRGLQRIRIANDQYLINSPGIIPPKENETEFELFLVESKNPNQLEDVEGAALKLIQYMGKEKIAKFSKLELSAEEIAATDEEELLEKIALKKKFLLREGKADTGKAARELLERYQKHELK